MDAQLPATGSSGILWWVIAAVVVLAVGGGLYAWSRRRGANVPGDSGEPPAA